MKSGIIIIAAGFWCRHSLQWRYNGRDSVSNHQPHHCLLNRLFGCRSKKISKLRVTGPCAGNSPETGEFPAQMASNAENVSTWWRHHEQDVWINRDAYNPRMVVNMYTKKQSASWRWTISIKESARYEAVFFSRKTHLQYSGAEPIQV